jgi:HSP20 family protein
LQRREHYLDELARIRGEINRLFESALMSAAPDAGGEAPLGVWMPAVDVASDSDGYRVFVELPGVAPEAVRCSVVDRRIEVAGERKVPSAEQTSFRRMESRYGPFRRTLELERALDPESLESRFDRGVLELTVRAAKSARS